MPNIYFMFMYNIVILNLSIITMLSVRNSRLDENKIQK